MKRRIARWLHDWLGWGFPIWPAAGGDAFQPTYVCRFCSHRVCLDSQGNWFHLGGPRHDA